MIEDSAEQIEFLKHELQRDEGLKLKPYRDTRGKLTIGIGRNLDDVGISFEEAEDLFQHDINRTVQRLDGALPWWRGLDYLRQRIIINMAFNMGAGKLLTFQRMLAALQNRNYEEASKEMLDSDWSRQVGDRAARLAEAMKGRT